MMNLTEILREKSITSLFQANTFKESWSNWNLEINRILSPQYSENELINLGDHLSEIFNSTNGTDGRTQSKLSGGGASWESLVCWYINLCSIGSRLVAIKKMSLVPKPIQEAITVNYGNFPCNTESDITLLIFPDLKEFNEDFGSINLLDREGKSFPTILKNGELNHNLINHLVDLNFHKMGVGIIQCKTNWNDNAQIPMLWDMIYSVGGFRNRNITIGKNSYSMKNVNEFSYSFVTVPSNKKSIFKPSSVAVKRVTNLSGGNYWGNPTVPNVAKSIKEIFGTNYNSAYTDGLRETIRRELTHLKSGEKYSYFNLG